MKYKALLLVIISIPLLCTHSAEAAQCTNNVCIDVYTDPATGKVVISATKIIPGSTPAPAPVAKVKSKPVTKPVTKPTVKRTPNPTPRPYVRHVPYVYHPPKPKPAPKPAKTSSTAQAVAAVNLADQISQLLPLRNIYVQPSHGAIASIPAYLWTDTHSLFNTTTQILGVAVGVTLNPTFTWNFGDGSSLTIDQPGGPLPDKTVSHTYKRAGRYLVTLTVSWLGTWAAGSYSYPVAGGAIVQSYSAVINVSPAPTLLHN